MAGTAVAPMPPAARAAIQARNTLGRAESSAANGNSGWFTGTGRDEESDGNTRIKGKIKSKVVLIVLLLLFGGAISFLGSSNTLLTGAFDDLIADAMDVQYASATKRNARLLKFNLGGDITTTTWSGAKKYKIISPAYKRRLAKQGIEIEGIGSHKILHYTHIDATGKSTTIDVSAADLDATLRSNADFRESYDLARRGRVGTFFDNVANRVFSKVLHISRNIQASYKQTGDAETDEINFRKLEIETLEGGKTTVDASVRATNDEDGESSTTNTRTDTDIADGNTPELRAKSFLTDIMPKVADATNIACTVLRIGSTIGTLIAANEIAQSIVYFSSLAEGFSKTKTGEGDESTINPTLNYLSASQRTKYTYIDAETGDNVTKSLEGSPLSTAEVQAVLGGAPMGPAKADANKYSVTRIFNRLAKPVGAIASALTLDAAKVAECAGTKILGSIISIATSIGPQGLVKAIGGFVLQFFANLTVQAALMALINFLVPTVAESLMTNRFESAIGPVAGAFLILGASAYGTNVARRSSAFSLGNKASILAYNQEIQDVIALDAEIDRKNHSPFDITNRNTFLGSLAYKFIFPLATSSNSIASFIRTTAKSISSIITPVHAAGEDSSYMTTFGDCKELEDIGAQGDIYCNPIVTMDVTTLDLSPNDSEYQKLISDNMEEGSCDEDGNGCVISSSGNLAKYITYCDGRDSPFGVLDAGILSQFETSTGNSTVDVILNSIPIVQDVIDVIDGFIDLDEETQAWATGAACVNNPETNPNWNNEYKYYQRYVEDMRLLENMGAFDGEDGNDHGQNPVTAFQEAYEKEHPIDNSPAGIIAHYTGASLETAEKTVAFIEYAQILNEYDPSTRIALIQESVFSQPATTISNNLASRRILFKQHSVATNKLTEAIVNKQHVVYFDIRNRSLIV